MTNHQQYLDTCSWSSGRPCESEVLVPVPAGIITSLDEHFQRHLHDNENGKALEQQAAEIDEQIQYRPAVDNKWFDELRLRLQQSPGFLCLSLSGDQYSNDQLRLVYYYIARKIGALDDRYGFLFDVVDQGLDYTKQAIPVSKTCAATSFHTDSTAIDYKPDVVGLLCINAAKEGGQSRLANAANMYQYLARHNPEAIRVLSQPIARDVITPGKEQSVAAIVNNCFPVFAFDEQGLRFRYMRFWIEQAYEKINERIPDDLIRSMNAVDSYLDDGENIFHVMLKRGQMIFMNNAFLCHDRTAFVDFENHTKKRTLVRTWINFYSLHSTDDR